MTIYTTQNSTNNASTNSTYKSTTYVPCFSFPGGKARLVKSLLPYFVQKGNTFADVFAGRGNVFFAAALTLNFKNWQINDIRTKPFFEAMLQYGDTVEILQRSRDNFDKLKSSPHTVEAILNETRLTYSGGGWRAGFAPPSDKVASVKGYRKKLVVGQSILMSCDPLLTDLDYQDVLAGLGQGDFAYLDPPYQNANVHAYSATDLDHRKMVDILLTAKFSWALSEYPNKMYDDAFGPPTFAQERSCAMDDKRGLRTECLWVSPPHI